MNTSQLMEPLKYYLYRTMLDRTLWKVQKSHYSTLVMIFMPHEAQGKQRKLALHTTARITFWTFNGYNTEAS